MKVISKERIDELLMKRAKIYGIGKQGDIFCLGLKFRPETLKNKKWLENKYEVYSKFFETKEEAEWHKEFGCIERTERLELPTWEDLKNCLNCFCYFTDCCGREYCLSYTRATNKLRLRYFVDELDEEEWGVWELTKKNYTIACRKAKELFLGGSNGDIR